MKITCEDLDRILREENPAEMTALEAHAADCPHCAEELEIWREISAAAPSLQKNWESPSLWPRIRQALAEENQKPQSANWADAHGSWLSGWRLAAGAAALLVVTMFATWTALRRLEPQIPGQAALEQKLLTEQALKEIETSEQAYRKSIEKLAAIAGPQAKQVNTPLMSSYREKLVLLDSAIEELRANAEQNPFNAHVRQELLSLYQQKRDTLEEISRTAAQPR